MFLLTNWPFTDDLLVLFTSEYRFAGQIYFCACSSQCVPYHVMDTYPSDLFYLCFQLNSPRQTLPHALVDSQFQTTTSQLSDSWLDLNISIVVFSATSFICGKSHVITYSIPTESTASVFNPNKSSDAFTRYYLSSLDFLCVGPCRSLAPSTMWVIIPVVECSMYQGFNSITK